MERIPLADKVNVCPNSPCESHPFWYFSNPSFDPLLNGYQDITYS